MKKYRSLLQEAVKYFWETRLSQNKNQGNKSGIKDQGNRSSVTGGAQLDGFINLFSSILSENGLPRNTIHVKETTIPGYFRPTKKWDLVVISEKKLIAIIELKSHVGPSFGNNFNNRVEEAVGSATDVLTAYREGKFKTSERPWIGYFMLLEKEDRSTRPVRTNEPYFPVFPEFHNASYKDRYERFCERLMLERLYDAACLLISSREEGMKGIFEEPNKELNFSNFTASLIGKAVMTSKKS